MTQAYDPSRFEPKQVKAGRDQETGNWLGNLLGGALDYIGRPQSALLSGLAAMAEGKDVGQAVGAGLGGISPIRTFQDVLKKQGVGEMGRFQLGPLDVTGRDIFSFPGELLTDPLSYVAGPALRGFKAVAPLAKGARIAEHVGPRTAVPIGETFEQALTQIGKPGLVRRAAETPYLGKVIRPIARLIDPSKVASGAETLPIALESVKAKLPSVTSMALAPLEAMGKMPFQVVGQGDAFVATGIKGALALVPKAQIEAAKKAGWTIGRPVRFGEVLRLDNGRLVPWNDVFTNPNRYKLNQAQLAYISQRGAIDEAFSDFAQKMGVPFEKRALEPGAQYHARYVIGTTKGATSAPPIRIIGGERGFQKDLAFPTQLAGMSQGNIYADALTASRLHLRESILSVAERGFAKAAEKLPGAVRVGGTPNTMLLRFPEALRDKVKKIELVDKVEDVSFEHSTGTLFVNPKSRDLLGDMAHELAHADIGRSYTSPVMQQYEAIQRGLGSEKHISRLYEQFADDVETHLKGGSLPQPVKDFMSNRYPKGLGPEISEEVPEGLMKTTLPALKGIAFTPEDAEIFQKMTRLEPNRFARNLGQANDTLRMMQTTFDFGAGQLQLLPLLFTSPLDWARVQIASARAIADPRYLDRIQATDWAQDVYRRMPGLQIGASEFFQGMEGGSLIAKAGQKVPALGTVVEQTFGRFQAGFEAAGTVGRLMTARSLLDLAESRGAVAETADFINKMFGTLSTQAMGVSSGQRLLETATLFAPRYTRAILALVGDAAAKGMAGDLARQNLARMLFVGPFMYTKIAQGLGQEPVLDPNDPRFLSIVTPQNERIGWGTPWVALAKLVGRTLAEPGKLAIDRDDLRDNPLINFWMGRLSPTADAITSLIRDETYMGEPLESPMDVARYAGSRALPFAAQNYLEPGRQPSPVRTAAELVGARTAPLGLTQVRDIVAQRMYGKPFDELRPLEQAEVRKQPEVAEMPLPMGGRYEGLRQREAVWSQYETAVNDMAQKVGKGQTKKGFRLFQERTADVRNAQLQALERVFPTKEPKALAALEAKRQAFLAHFRQVDEFGETPYEEAERFYASLTAEERQYIVEKDLASYQKLEPTAARMMTDLWRARRELKGYWEIGDRMLQRYGLARRWEAATPQQRQAISRSEAYRQAMSAVRKEREALRRRNPKVDRLLVEWGYVSKPITERKT